MRARIPAFLASLTVAAALGCGSAGFVSTWQQPADGPIEFQGQRVAAVVVHPDSSLRRPAENTLARELSRRGVQGIAAHVLYQGEAPLEEDALRRTLQEANLRGVVVMLPVATGEKPSESRGDGPWFSGSRYDSFYEYWRHGWSAASRPGDLRHDEAYVEALVFSVPSGELLWAGRSGATSASDVAKLVRDLADDAASEMTKAGFIR